MDVSTLDPGLLNMTLQLVYTSIIWNISRTVDPPLLLDPVQLIPENSGLQD